MTEDNFTKLGSIVEKDIQSIFNIIASKIDYQMLNFDLRIIKNHRINFKFEFEYFKEIINKEIYNLKDSDKILDERIDLFNKIFINPFGDFNSISFHTHFTGMLTTMENPIRELFFKTLFFLFCKAVLFEFDYINALREMFEEWRKCRELNKIIVEIIIPLNNIIFRGIHSILKDKVFIYGNYVLKLIKKNSDENTRTKSYILIKSHLRAYIYKDIPEINTRYEKRSILEKDWERLLIEIQEIVCTFYLCDVDFKYQKFFIIFPWWHLENQEKLKDILTGESNKTKLSITKDTLEQITKFLPLVKNSKYFSNEQYMIIYHNFMQVYNREYTPDILVDIAILFEFLFAREDHQNITFWLSFNAAMFLSEEKDMFLESFRFFKKFYGVRSALVHGDKWYFRFEKILLEEYGTDLPEPYLNRCKSYLNYSLRKLVELREKNPNILDDIFELQVEKNKNKKVKFLQLLASYYEEIGACSESIKILSEALKFTEDIKDNKELEENILKKIAALYNRKVDIIIFSEEFQKVLFELKMIFKLDDKREKLAKEILENIKKLLKTIELKKPEEILKLKIDGFEIMDILGIKPRPRIGEILSILEEKVTKGELNNNKTELAEYIIENFKK